MALHTLTIHLASTVRPQRLMLHNREHLVAPAVLIVEGVLNGALIPGEELRPEDWNGVAVVVNHPTDASGTPISARNPEVLAAYGVGQLYHASLGTSQRQRETVATLRAELWLDVAQCVALGGEALQAFQMLETQQPLEVSTGFFCDSEATRGAFAGTPYQEIHHNLRPDHLALLPNAIGACSVADGCGAPRLNQQHCGASCQCGGACQRRPMDAPTRLQRLLAMFRLKPQETGEDALVVEQTDTDIREALYGALAREMGVDVTPIFIDALDLTAQSFTYRQGERLRRRRWETNEGGVLTLAPEIEDVQRDTTYRPVPMVDNTQEETAPMATPQDALKARVNALIANAQSGWTETDRPMLEAMSEAQLIRLEAQPKRLVVATVADPQSVQEAIARMPGHLQEPLMAMANEYEQRKSAAIGVLVANKCPIPQEDLQAMTAQRLEELVAFAGQSQSSYAGRGMPHQRPVANAETPPPAPSTLDRVLERQKALGLR